MWPQTRLPPHPAMAEETQQSKLAAAKKKLKEYWQRNSPGVPARAKRNRKTNGSVPETATSGGSHTHPSCNDCSLYLSPDSSSTSSSLHMPQSPCQELAVVLDSRSVKISQLKNTIKSLKQQKKQVEHQLEEEKKANNEKQKTERELEVQIQRLNMQKGKLSTDLYRTKRSLRYFEEESKDLADRLQCSLQRKGELEQALSAVTATQKKKVDRSSSHRKARMEWKLEWSTREQALLKAQMTQLKESLKQAHLERDEYVQHLKGERARWQQRMKKMSQEVCTLKKEKKDDMRRVEKLERSFRPGIRGLWGELQHLRKELERVSAELQAQVENQQHVSLLNQAQKERLRRQEERLQQLAEPQSGFEELNNENKSALQLEQQVEELQEKVGEVKGTVTSAPSKKGREAGTNLWGGESGLMDLLEEKADLRERVEKLEVQFILGGQGTSGGSVKDAARGGHHQAGPGQGGDEGEAAGASGDGVAACADHNNQHSKLLTSSQNSAHEPGPGAPAPQELGAAHKHGDLRDMSLTDSAETGQGEAREGSPHNNPTAQPITQEHQEHPGLGSNRSVPFFCWAWLPRRRR
uniref:Golgin subfamily A conserved domain-containing protein n=1 Tax=Theropithecus gelada TaxID=9565 RepID=A0A8D2FTN7_THEGE